MFVQIMEAHTSDPEGVKRMGERWQSELRPGATGYLGVTAGSTADGRSIAIVRFASEEAARANSDRPEQGAWFAEMAKCFDEPPSFVESSDVQELMGGPSTEAGFVQIMKATGIDRAQIERLDDSFEPYLSLRPDLIGGLRVWTGADSYVEVGYFTSEAEAREGEKADLPADLQPIMAEFGALMANTEYLDLSDPQVH